jgi:hypothetical protein
MNIREVDGLATAVEYIPARGGHSAQYDAPALRVNATGHIGIWPAAAKLLPEGTRRVRILWVRERRQLLLIPGAAGMVPVRPGHNSAGLQIAAAKGLRRWMEANGISTGTYRVEGRRDGSLLATFTGK